MRYLKVLRSVSEISVLTGLSKVSIYNKLKLKEMKDYIIKNKGVTYVSEEGYALILDKFNLKKEALNNLKNDTKNIKDEIALDIENKDIEEFKLEFKKLKQDYINSLKLEIENLKVQLEKKDNQINELMGLNKNNQILLKQQQDKEINQIQLEDHFKEVDEKLGELKSRMDNRKSEKTSFWNRFKK